jgi:hypothetical protein
VLPVEDDRTYAQLGGRADLLDPVVHRLARHAEAVLRVERTVVDFGKEVTVKVDHRVRSYPADTRKTG